MPVSRNAFTTDFLHRLDQAGEPDGAREADVAGPWVVRRVRYQGTFGFAVLRDWESPQDGDAPCAIFRRRETALLAAAVLPALGREPLYRLATEPDAAGFPLQAGTGPRDPALVPAAVAVTAIPHPGIAGHLRDFDEDLATALQLVAALVRSPLSLASLLEAAGHVAVEQAGRILTTRLEGKLSE
jgi:hypothetical protein